MGRLMNDGRMHNWISGWGTDRWMSGWWTIGWKRGWWADGWWMSGWMDGCEWMMDRQMDGRWMNEWKDDGWGDPPLVDLYVLTSWFLAWAEGTVPAFGLISMELLRSRLRICEPAPIEIFVHPERQCCRRNRNNARKKQVRSPIVHTHFTANYSFLSTD